ncbi:MAG: hypothetical protein ACYC46_05190 [Acidobacteriaceae bacterium]
MNHSAKEYLYVVFMSALVVAPMAGMAIAWLLWKHQPNQSIHRKWTAVIGLILGTQASTAAPLFLAGVSAHLFRPANTHLLSFATWYLFVGLIGGAVALIPLAFGYGRARSIGMFSAVLSCAVCYITLLAISY